MISNRNENKNKNNLKLINENFQNWILNEEESGGYPPNYPKPGQQIQANRDGKKVYPEHWPKGVPLIAKKVGNNYVFSGLYDEIYAHFRKLSIMMDKRMSAKKDSLAKKLKANATAIIDEFIKREYNDKDLTRGKEMDQRHAITKAKKKKRKDMNTTADEFIQAYVENVITNNALTWSSLGYLFGIQQEAFLKNRKRHNVMYAIRIPAGGQAFNGIKEKVRGLASHLQSKVTVLDYFDGTINPVAYSSWYSDLIVNFESSGVKFYMAQLYNVIESYSLKAFSPEKAVQQNKSASSAALPPGGMTPADGQAMMSTDDSASQMSQPEDVNQSIDTGPQAQMSQPEDVNQSIEKPARNASAGQTQSTPAKSTPTARTARASSAVGGGSIDRRRTRIARQTIGQNAVRRLQRALAQAGFPPVEGMEVSQQVQEVKKHNIKSISNNWSSWLLSERVTEIKPEDYEKYGIDGKYGKNTIAAVKAFQKAVKSDNPKANLGKSGPGNDGVDGTVGKLTWALLQKAAKGDLKVKPPVAAQKTGTKGEDLAQTRKTTKAADDAREKLRKGRFKFLEEVHKLVLAAVKLPGSAYADLVEFTKSTKASMGKEGIALWNDFRFWEAWINEDTAVIKKLVSSRKENKGKNYKKAFRSFPKGAEKARLKALLEKHKAEIDAWNKAFEASLKQKYPDETPEQAKKKKIDKAAQLDNLKFIFDSMAGLTGGEAYQAELIKAENRFQEMLEEGKLAAMASGARVANKHKINIGNPNKTGAGIAKQGNLTEDASTLYGALEPNGTDEDAVESTIKKYLGAMSGNLKDFNRTHFINPSYGYFKAHTLLFYYNGFEEANGTNMGLLERLKDDGEDAIAKKLERRLDYEKRFAIILLGLIDPNNKKSLINQYKLATSDDPKGEVQEDLDIIDKFDEFKGLFSISKMAKPPFKLVRKPKNKPAKQVTKPSPAPGRPAPKKPDPKAVRQRRRRPPAAGTQKPFGSLYIPER